ncbi:hypothetical protein SSP531S_18020 [Streptomyces spongiicola]|uniref:Secreted protein n=1 Tax=Streptomyces spongiicola TaxID=1690221 RepID=A0A2S1Z4A9_9ACTN|nr:hypothetical protein [Streptomyces spongiicola]AWK11176.1 hypothetical protein DDQ41_22190 [Streptomyces spongiicola]GBQ00387.1 hypothetical protein SSP531S_18020 [Streptomyces spongiicola]
MSHRYGVTTRRAVAAAFLAAVLPLSLTACGGDDAESAKGKGSSSSAPANSESSKTQDGANTVPDTTTTLATIKGSNGFHFVIHGAVRDQGGFLTVTGTLRNTSGKRAFAPIEWNGQETSVRRTGRSLAGMTLVDKAEKKRYYVLRDTEGFPLTTTGITGVDAGDNGISFFAQFPSPPEETTQVDIQIPLMPTATIEIS